MTQKQIARLTKKALSGQFNTVRNMTSANGNDVPNQFIINTSEAMIFQSYNSVIAIVPHGEGKTIIGKDFDYSNTTMKYLKEFLYNNGIAETRKLIEDGTYIYNEDLR